MPENSFKTTIVSSVLWKFLEQISASAIGLIIQIILARLLLPEEYGIIAIVIVFISLSNVFIQNGFNAALIQNKDVTDTDYSSVFYVSILIALVLYILLFIASPFIASFFGNEIISPVLRVLGLTLFFGAFNSIQNAIIVRNFRFKKLFVARIIATVLAGSIGISMAYFGYGIWALVAQQLLSIITISILLLYTVQWVPRLLFSFQRVKVLFSFGWKILVSSLLDTGYNQLSNLIVGKMYSPATLGYYSKGYEFPSILVVNIDYSIQSVMLPACSKIQDNINGVKELMRRTLKMSSFLVFPAMAGLAAIAYPMVDVLLTDKWIICVPFIQIFCLTCAFWPIEGSITQVLNGLGKSGVYLKLKIIGKIVGLAILSVTVFISVEAIAFGTLISGVIFIYFLSIATKKIMNYSFLDIWKEIFPSLLLSFLMFGVVYLISFIDLPSLVILLIQIPSGFLFYFGMAKLLKIESLSYLLNALKESIQTKNVKEN